MSLTVNDCYKPGLKIVREKPGVSLEEFTERLILLSQDKTLDGMALG